MAISQSAVTGNPSAGIKGQARVFTITEMVRIGDSLQPSGVEFKFSTENFAAPRGPWSYGIKLRTVRRDLPGSEEPVEQVLGWNYTPFQINGVWDDRHGGANFATATRRAFEEMVKRGRAIKIQMEDLAIEGLITDLNITRARKDLMGYQFTFSPHKRDEGDSVRQDASPNLRVTTDPRTSVLKARRALEGLQAEQARARAASLSAVQQKLSTGIFGEINSDIDEMAVAITSAENTVDKEILKAEEAANALNRGAQTMAGVKTIVSRLLERTRVIAATTHLASETIVDVMSFESWHRGVSAGARRFAITAGLAQNDFALRARPKPRRLHRVRPGETLYQISTRYYGTPHQWRSILKHNHLSSIILEGGELLEIQELR
jgi:LysM domain-containing protein